VHVYEVRPRSDQRGFDLISYVLPFGRLWYAEPNAVERRRLWIYASCCMVSDVPAGLRHGRMRQMNMSIFKLIPRLVATLRAWLRVRARLRF